jgi:hypothetical protein
MANRDVRQLVKDWIDLEAAGVPLEPPELRVGYDAQNSGAELTIKPGRDHWRAQIRELKGGRLAYILPIFVRRDRPGKTIIRDAWITAPWPDTVELIGDLKEGAKPAYYAFPDDAEIFQRDDVLNHRLHCVLARGDIREGLLLGLGSCPPDEFKNQSKIQVTFGILDQWDQEHPAKLELTLNRLPPRAKPMITSTRGPLLSRRDILPQTHPLVAPRDPTAETRKKDAAADRRTPEDVMREQSKHKRAKMPAESKTRAR